MSELVGKKILHYRILEQIGQGGMGVVYKAEDTKLERTVALKFLPTNTLVGDEEKKRFKREAKAAAALNHANICHIYAIDEVDGQLFIAMEYIDGQSLDERINSPLEGGAAPAAGGVGRPLDLETAIDYACQISAGLQAAHEKSVIHRDIKSANIMVTDKGVVKIMDFGLAKLANRSKMTVEGSTLGTAAYMSPEQARGEVLDKRSDIWSLGVVLYEIISGQMPFRGDYEQAAIYSILHDEPEPLTALRSGLPIALDGIVAKALAKDPGMRYQNVEELPADLKALGTDSLGRSRISKAVQPSEGFKPSEGSWLSWAMAGLMTFLAAAALWYGWSANSGDPTFGGVKRATISLAPSQGLDGRFVLSPDGAVLVFDGRAGAGNQLFLRHLDQGQAVALAGTEGGGAPFFSPDGKWIGFRTRTKLKKVSVDGGSPVDICDAFAREASWGPQGEIVFSQNPGSGKPWELMRVSAQGGLPEPLPTDETETNFQVRSPQVLPGGRHVLFTVIPATIEEGSIVVQSLANGEKRTLIQGGTTQRYVATGHIIFIRSNTLMAVPFDLESLTVTGPVIPIANDVFTDANATRFFTVSMDGTLIYRSEEENEGRGLIWVDRQGGVTPIAAPAHVYWDPRMSPDGRHVAINSRDGNEDIWVFELARGTLTRISFNPGHDETPFWSPDGQWIAFASILAEQSLTVFRKRADGSGDPEPLWTSDHHVHVECWSADGRSIIVMDRDPNTLEDLWLIRIGDKIAARPLLQTQFTEYGGRISPDGRWLVYTSDESGRSEVYVRAFPNMDNKVQVSATGGFQAIWAANGKDLFYRDPDHVYAVSVVPGKKFAVTSPKKLFSDPFALKRGIHTHYDVSRDGKRFLMVESGAQDRTSLKVVFNWFEELKRLAPEGK